MALLLVLFVVGAAIAAVIFAVSTNRNPSNDVTPRRSYTVAAVLCMLASLASLMMLVLLLVVLWDFIGSWQGMIEEVLGDITLFVLSALLALATVILLATSLICWFRRDRVR